MSGGSLDYASFKINEIIENIECFIRSDWKESEYDYDMLCNMNEDQKEPFKEKVLQLKEKLESISKELHALEWYLSGDDGVEDFLGGKK